MARPRARRHSDLGVVVRGRGSRVVHSLTVVPIPGTRKRSRLLENAAATRITLTAEELALLEPIAGQVAGDRYSDMSLTSVGRES